MSTVELSWVTANCGNGARTFKVCTSCFEVPALCCHWWKLNPYISGFRARQHLRSLAPVMNDGWMMMAKWYSGTLGPKASWHLSYRWGKTPKKTSPRKPVPTGDRTRARCVTSAHATTCSTAVDVTDESFTVHITHSSMNFCCIAPLCIKKPNYSVHFTFMVLCMFTFSLRAHNWQVRCDTIEGLTTDIVQHICAKLQLSFTIVLISRPIGPFKKIAYVYFILFWAK